MPFEIVHGDITKIQADAIVNAANAGLQRGGGVCGAIFAAAGAAELQAECDQVGHCDTGQAVITKGYQLPAKHIIHSVGPVWRGGSYQEERLLYNCYQNSLKLAKAFGCESIAFPLISSGIYGYPKEQALEVAERAIRDYLQEEDLYVQLVIFDRKTFPLNGAIHQAIETYLQENFVDEARAPSNSDFLGRTQMVMDATLSELEIDFDKSARPRSLDDVVGVLEESFTDRVLRMIDERGLSDADVYKRANLDRRLFSKLRKGNGYQPSKATALALAIALELNLDDTLDLLKTAGYALSASNRADVIVQFFIEEEHFDIFAINDALFKYEEKLLGA